MPSFGGVNIFGTAVRMITVENLRERQVNSYFGVSGLETLDGGLRGRITSVMGLLSGSSAGGLAEAEVLFRSYNDGVARTLVDPSGASWSNVRLEYYYPWGRVGQSLNGLFLRAYNARFMHLA